MSKKETLVQHVKDSTNDVFFVNKNFDWVGRKKPGFMEMKREDILKDDVQATVDAAKEAAEKEEKEAEEKAIKAAAEKAKEDAKAAAEKAKEDAKSKK